MSVPSHNLYDFVHQVLERRYWLFYFYPWGSRDLTAAIDYYDTLEEILGPKGIDSKYLYAQQIFGPDQLDWFKIRNTQPILFCHDQEPLNFDLYLDHAPGCHDLLQETPEDKKPRPGIPIYHSNEHIPFQDLNLRWRQPWSMQQQWILLHSELNSDQVRKYESTGQYQGAYWWSHAMISRDWYRFARYDRSLENRVSSPQLFLIYSRDTTGSRSYRQQFLNSLGSIKNHCQIGSQDGSTVTADSSANYNVNDFVNTDISIVLETVFDNRIHLTEKTLRPIACGHPFILAAGAGSLALLRGYGFQTFAPWIDESYDLESDPLKRLDMIIKEMSRISRLSAADKQTLITACRDIATHNRQHFFSDQFEQNIVNELKQNVDSAWYRTGNRLNFDTYLANSAWRKKYRPDLACSDRVRKNREYLIPLARHCRTNGGSFEQYQRHQHSLDDKSSADGNDV